MSGFRDDVTGRPLVVSNKSTQVVVKALVSAHRAGDISDGEYAMAYAEICEPGFLPQALGGGPVLPETMAKWQSRKSWS